MDNNNFINTNATESNQSNNFKAAKPKKVKQNKDKGDFNFGKSVAVPFVSGLVGASLIVGICFNVPSIKSKLLEGNYSNRQESSPILDYNNVNLNLVSLSNISDTGVYVANKVLPSIVGIKVDFSINSIFSRNSSTVSAEGSGVIISSDGYILTNNHVIDSSGSSSNSYYEVGEAAKIQVYLYNDDTPYDAKIIGTDEQTDLAVIKINKSDLVAAELGDSDTVQVGEWCMTIGNPLGMKSTVCQGSISALNREITDSEGKTYSVLQTDAAINEGNSGGALVNSKGQVIGINTLKASGEGVEGLGFAIPINSTKTIYNDLIQYNKVKRPYIGITGSDVTEKTIKANPTFDLKLGAYVRSIDDFSPAEKAGLKIGDIIVAADGQKVESMDDLNKVKNSHKIGDKISLTIYRDKKEFTVELTLVEQP